VEQEEEEEEMMMMMNMMLGLCKGIEARRRSGREGKQTRWRGCAVGKRAGRERGSSRTTQAAAAVVVWWWMWTWGGILP